METHLSALCACADTLASNNSYQDRMNIGKRVQFLASMVLLRLDCYSSSIQVSNTILAVRNILKFVLCTRSNTLLVPRTSLKPSVTFSNAREFSDVEQ
jgi:hypothetical protein